MGKKVWISSRSGDVHTEFRISGEGLLGREEGGGDCLGWGKGVKEKKEWYRGRGGLTQGGHQGDSVSWENEDRGGKGALGGSK